MKLNEPYSNEVVFTIKQAWCGMVVMKRVSVPDEAPGTWKWGPWRKATITDLGFLMCRINKEN